MKIPKSPSVEFIKFMIKNSGLPVLEFLKLFGIPLDTYKTFAYRKNKGTRLELPARYWYAFYDPPKEILDKLNLRCDYKKLVEQEFFIQDTKQGVDDLVEKKEEVKEQKPEIKRIGVLNDLLRFFAYCIFSQLFLQL